jgi:hypothetical protein
LGKITAMFQTTNQISSLIPIHDISPETAPWPGPSPSRSFQCPRGPRAPRRRAGARRRSRCLTTGGQVETKKNDEQKQSSDDFKCDPLLNNKSNQYFFGGGMFLYHFKCYKLTGVNRC